MSDLHPTVARITVGEESFDCDARELLAILSSGSLACHRVASAYCEHRGPHATRDHHYRLSHHSAVWAGKVERHLRRAGFLS
jgi:hypothetical protein